jgi:RNA polymerase sigma-70 factor (ECF subfamily)
LERKEGLGVLLEELDKPELHAQVWKLWKERGMFAVVNSARQSGAMSRLVRFCVAGYSTARNQAQGSVSIDKKENRGAMALLADEVFIADLRRQMIKFAILQLHDEQQAEDAVQEALIGAMRNVQSFGGRAAFKTWVFAILKNKIADCLRGRLREVNIGSLVSDADEEADFSELFDRKGFWLEGERPGAWGEPEQVMQDADFWRVFETCLDHLPPKQARVFMMREFVELESEEICTTLTLSTSNLYVILHRARLRLRECLEDHWFLQGERP